MTLTLEKLAEFVKNSEKWSRWTTPKVEVFYTGASDEDHAMIYVEFGILMNRYYLAGKLGNEHYETFSKPSTLIRDLFEHTRERYWSKKVKR